MKELTYKIYCDGACVPNPGEGGCGGIVICSDLTAEYFYRYISFTSNNQMEILGALEGLKLTPEECKVEVYSDSQYVVKTMTDNWKTNKNKELWCCLKHEAYIRETKFYWVKGHNENCFNEFSDILSNKGLKIKNRELIKVRLEKDEFIDLYESRIFEGIEF